MDFEQRDPNGGEAASAGSAPALVDGGNGRPLNATVSARAVLANTARSWPAGWFGDGVSA